MASVDYDETCPLGKGFVTLTQERVHPPGTQGYKVITATCQLNEIEGSDCNESRPLVNKYCYASS